MTLDQLLVNMFPGDECSGLPAFDKLLNAMAFKSGDNSVELLDDYLGSYVEFQRGMEVNEILRIIRKEKPELVNRFVTKSIEFYFSNPQVVSVLRKGVTTLFPHQRSLPDVNFDLLIPVLDLGCREDIYG